MKKIKTIFERDWEGNRKVINQETEKGLLEDLESFTATEKLDGTNVRITVRSHTVVRVEKRRNPDKIQKHKGIEEPWYTEADEFAPTDKHIFNAVSHTKFEDIPDGEWSGECVGSDIQGNPMNLAYNRIVFFSLGQAPVFKNVPTSYEGLKEWLPKQKSKYGTDCGIEGIVWHSADGEMYKIKCKDF